MRLQTCHDAGVLGIKMHEVVPYICGGNLPEAMPCRLLRSSCMLQGMQDQPRISRLVQSKWIGIH